MTEEQRQHCINVAIDAWGADPHAATPLVKYALVRILVNEVSNGSFAQYFSNSYSADAERANCALVEIDGETSAKVFPKALGQFSSIGVLADAEAVEAELNAMPADAFDDVSDEFLAHQPQIEAALDRYANRFAFDFGI